MPRKRPRSMRALSFTVAPIDTGAFARNDRATVEPLIALFPKADDLLAVSPEELGPVLMRIAVARAQQAGGQSLLSLELVTGDFSYDVQHMGNQFMVGR